MELEIVKEEMNKMSDNIEALKETARGLGKIAYNIGKGTYYCATAPFMIPRRVRQAEDFTDSGYDDGFGIPAFIFSTAAAIGLCYIGHQETGFLKYAMMSPIITNPISALYEYYDYKKNEITKKKAVAPSIPNMPASKNLETKASENIQPTTQTTQAPVKKITDPWSFDIPEIKNQVYPSGGEK
jgi:hypothetical protein